VPFVTAVHRGGFILVCAAVLRRVVISMNGAPLSRAAGTANGHHSGDGHRGVDQKQGDQAGNCRDGLLQSLTETLPAEISHIQG
jgi:hypothetical protein